MLGIWHGLQPFGVVLWVLVVFFSILVHEMGHALTALLFEREVSIELTGLGGITYQKGLFPLKLWQEFLVVFNGPLAGFLLFFCAYSLKTSFSSLHPYVNTCLSFAIFINLYWNLLNLLPITPLDGGRILSILMESLMGINGMKWSLLFGCSFGVLLALLFFSWGNPLGGAIFCMLSFESYQSYGEVRDVSNEDRDEALIHRFNEAKKALADSRHQKAYSLFKEIMETTNKGRTRTSAILHMAFILSGWGEGKKAYELLLPLKDSLLEESLDFLHSLAFYNQDYALVVELGDRCYQEFPSYEVAFNNAAAHAHLENVHACIGWLQCARSEAMPDLLEHLKRQEFDRIREEKLFKEFEALLV